MLWTTEDPFECNWFWYSWPMGWFKIWDVRRQDLIWPATVVPWSSNCCSLVPTEARISSMCMCTESRSSFSLSFSLLSQSFSASSSPWSELIWKRHTYTNMHTKHTHTHMHTHNTNKCPQRHKHTQVHTKHTHAHKTHIHTHPQFPFLTFSLESIKQRACSSSCVANMSAIQRQSHRTTISEWYHWIIKSKTHTHTHTHKKSKVVFSPFPLLLALKKEESTLHSWGPFLLTGIMTILLFVCTLSFRSISSGSPKEAAGAFHPWSSPGLDQKSVG